MSQQLFRINISAGAPKVFYIHFVFSCICSSAVDSNNNPNEKGVEDITLADWSIEKKQKYVEMVRQQILNPERVKYVKNGTGGSWLLNVGKKNWTPRHSAGTLVGSIVAEVTGATKGCLWCNAKGKLLPHLQIKSGHVFCSEYGLFLHTPSLFPYITNVLAHNTSRPGRSNKSETPGKEKAADKKVAQSKVTKPKVVEDREV